MMPAMAAVHVPVCRFLVPPPQLAYPTTRPMARAVSLITRQRVWVVTTVTTAQEMMRAMAAGRA